MLDFLAILGWKICNCRCVKGTERCVLCECKCKCQTVISLSLSTSYVKGYKACIIHPLCWHTVDILQWNYKKIVFFLSICGIFSYAFALFLSHTHTNTHMWAWCLDVCCVNGPWAGTVWSSIVKWTIMIIWNASLSKCVMCCDVYEGQGLAGRMDFPSLTECSVCFTHILNVSDG